MLKSRINELLKSKSDMMADANNQSCDIEWKCVRNGKHVIILYNDYSESHFKIIIHKDGDIEATDELLGNTVCYLIKGDKWYHDFKTEDGGIELAINAVFSYFYCQY